MQRNSLLQLELELTTEATAYNSWLNRIVEHAQEVPNHPHTWALMALSASTPHSDPYIGTQHPYQAW